jgi:hypothetical protein
MLEPGHRNGQGMASLADAHVLEARGLLANLLDARASVSSKTNLDVLQALCELAPPGALPAYPSTTSATADAVADLRTARSHLRQAIADEFEVGVVLRLAAAIRCIDAALRAVPS